MLGSFCTLGSRCEDPGGAVGSAATDEQELPAASGLLRSRVHLGFCSWLLPCEFIVRCDVEGAGSYVRSSKSGELVCLNFPMMTLFLWILLPAACAAQLRWSSVPGCTRSTHQNQLCSECRITLTVVVSCN